jgi:hypothetical protein
MERIHTLISKLNQQVAQEADATQLLATVQLLHSELVSQQQGTKRLGTSKVAVMLPASMTMDALQYERYAPQPQERTVAAPVQETVVIEERQTISFTQESVQNEIVRDPLNEIPTLSQQINGKDIQESLNDKLKQVKTELAEVLKETPVKDLRKAIGINDRFVFINDLFRGDEVMYERSIKTINGFNIFPEAEYWISRELKVKLGWNSDHPLVLQFDQLVKRRFS